MAALSLSFNRSSTSLFLPNALSPPTPAAACRLSLTSPPANHHLISLHTCRPLSLRSRRLLPLFSFAQDSSRPSDIDIDDKGNGHLEEEEAGESQREEAWKQTLESFKEQALKLQAVSHEAYQLYSQKAIVILNETSEKLKIQADKARQDLTVIAKELALESKEYLANAAENTPEPVKDIVETFASSPDDLNEVSKVRDFYVGIPYGAFLSVCGFLSFMIFGSLSGIRFGLILGGTLLALSISSLRSWKKGESSPLALKGQAGLFLYWSYA
ncbi:OLC1v1033551C1 [Oldenlandia corymbosa var. corymbosa]|uniref:OLC1v1033551C1 n=1 Tax=Oldenlandia corymbosa var. corymbosa TaxID=529605 RepID=A0AAV1CNK5_OLDCO|nr:OLC1v1033551C1 [Oldenlandia corymbosa var. corymbosa]